MGSRKRLSLFRKLINKLFHKNKKSLETEKYISEIKTYTFRDNKEGIEKLERFIEILDVLDANYTEFHNVAGGYYNVHVKVVRNV